MNRFNDIIKNIVAWDKSENKIHALIIVGSQTRENHQADESSDLDLFLIVDEPDYFILSDDWVENIGTFYISFTDDFVSGGKTRRILFGGALDVDFIFLPKKHIEKVIEDDIIIAILERGWRILIDKIGLEKHLPPVRVFNQPYDFLTEKEFHNIVNDFWYHSVWTAKKIMRGEIWTARYCLDIYMKSMVLRFIESYMKATKGSDYNTWYSGRFIEEWADNWIIEKLSYCFSRYDKEDIKLALRSTIDLFRQLAEGITEKLHYKYPQKADEYATDWVMKHLFLNY